jgi:Zn-finger nucleic acid-binding protein
MQCPVCNVPLTMSDRQGIEIDYCPQCRGVWLDRGELDKIIERSHAATAPRPPEMRSREDERRYREEPDQYRQKRRKNWLEELFD